ncbi:hypothetical protein SAMN06297387_101506 [Streptomyces zhaozhouensis]|uniref:Uncharacterized protein n=1 Tax=Streptomyces zhaozhouensis TaxID=1300267 RepID=A0A286DKK0_9ACTN|nr:hypothetical protein [Streptomyces zhaozhouensis]SOD59149.1 hypothetical protein SAMN06297387_101506 [Streptomyces zhaozhouensis]
METGKEPSAAVGPSPPGDAAQRLLTWIAQVAEEPLVLNAADRSAELAANTWRLGASDEDRRSLTVGAVAAAFERTADGIAARIAGAGFAGPVTFYVWHDAQAGQLRCSTGSVTPDRLPFRGTHVPVGELAPALAPFLDADPESAAGAGPLTVWVRAVGRR